MSSQTPSSSSALAWRIQAVSRVFMRRRWRPDAGDGARLAIARDPTGALEAAQFELVEVNDFAGAAISAFKQHTRDSVLRFRDVRKFDSPDVVFGLENFHAVDVAFFLTTELADDADMTLAVLFRRGQAADQNVRIGREIAVEQDDRAGAINLHGACGLREVLVVAISDGSFQKKSQRDPITATLSRRTHANPSWNE